MVQILARNLTKRKKTFKKPKNVKLSLFCTFFRSFGVFWFFWWISQPTTATTNTVVALRVFLSVERIVFRSLRPRQSSVAPTWAQVGHTHTPTHQHYTAASETNNLLFNFQVNCDFCCCFCFNFAQFFENYFEVFFLIFLILFEKFRWIFFGSF